MTPAEAAPAHAGAPASPLVSVLIPCWNAEATIGRALRTVLDARSVDLECVVVDDGSTDRTAAVVADASAGDPRVVLVRLETNGGVSNARNVGLARIRGAWLTMLDADDLFLPGGIEALVRAALATNARAVLGQQVWTDGTRSWVPPLYDVPDLRRPGRASLAERPGLLNSVSPHAKLFHRSCFQGLEFSGRVLGDQPWIIRAMIRAGDDIEVIADTVYAWYRPPRGTQTASITATTRASAERSLAVVDVATGAVAAVDLEAARLGAAARDTIIGSYVDRLFRADLGQVVARAVARRDPATAALLDRMVTFIESVRPADLRAGQALAREVLEPPLRGWAGLDSAARAAHRRLVDAAMAADPGCVRRRPLLARAGVALVLRGPRGAGQLLGAGLLRLQWLAERIARRLRRMLPHGAERGPVLPSAGV